MPEIFKKIPRRRLLGGFIKPGEPFSLFSPHGNDPFNILGIPLYNKRGPPNRRVIFSGDWTSFSDRHIEAGFNGVPECRKEKIRVAN
jgi:hypothetical protein